MVTTLTSVFFTTLRHVKQRFKNGPNNNKKIHNQKTKVGKGKETYERIKTLQQWKDRYRYRGTAEQRQSIDEQLM